MAEINSDTIVPERDLHDFIVKAMMKVGSRKTQAEALAGVIVAADVRGHYSHGLNRLDFYLSDIVDGNTKVDTEPTTLKETAATALVDGHNCIGPVVGRYCMDIAIQKAKTAGVGWVCAKKSNHFGIAGWYSLQAMEQGLIGMAFTNTSPNMIITRSKERCLGTNAISVGAKGDHNDEFVLDMATTAVAQGKVELKQRLGKDVPLGWGVDRNGKLTTDTQEVLHHGGLCPLGGSEETSGYKGYGLALMVELFCGILSGSAFGKDVRRWNNHHGVADLGQCFVAIDPKAFAPGFEGRMSELIHQCKSSELADGETEILVPGDPEKAHEKLCKKLGGIPYHPNQITFADEIARRYGIEPLHRLQ